MFNIFIVIFISKKKTLVMVILTNDELMTGIKYDELLKRLESELPKRKF